jgi:hypothetical protein
MMEGFPHMMGEHICQRLIYMDGGTYSSIVDMHEGGTSSHEGGIPSSIVEIQEGLLHMKEELSQWIDKHGL